MLWDMDGTLVDTEPSWVSAEHAIVEEHGGTWSHELALELVGNDLMDSAHFIKRHSSVPWTPHEIVCELINRVEADLWREVPWRPGARETLAAVAAAGIPQALVTMSWAPLVAPLLAGLPEGTFTSIVTGDMVTAGKPHPEPYLTAAAALGAEPGRCVAVEDSQTGLRSALAAGAVAIGVPHLVDLTVIEGAHLVLDLTPLTPDYLDTLVCSRL